MSNGSNEPGTPQGHPAYKEILDLLPESLHPLITPKLSEWDKRQQDKLQEVQGTYDPYKKFAENHVDPQVIEQALYLANHLQNNPADFVERAITNFNLEQFKQQQQQNELEDELVDYDGEDISKHPLVKQMMDQLQQTQQTLQTWQQEREQTTQEQQLEEYLDSLEKEHGEFDRLYVASMLANNVDGPQAVKQYQDMVNQAALKLTGGNPEQLQQYQQEQQTPSQQQTQIPVVMGAAGTAGSGSPNQPVDMSALSAGDTQNLVIQMLEAAAKDNQ